MARAITKRVALGISAILERFHERTTLAMVIQLTKGEMAILQQAALGRPLRRTAAGVAADPDLALLLDMQLVVQTAGRLEITAIGQRVLQMARDDPHRV